MRKCISEDQNTDMLREYDFASGTRGKHAKAYGKGHAVRVHKADGTTLVQHFTLEEGAVLLAPDVRQYFTDSESVNKALRSLITLIPEKKRGKHVRTKQS